jgi:hypothetical protein
MLTETDDMIGILLGMAAWSSIAALVPGWAQMALLRTWVLDVDPEDEKR